MHRKFETPGNFGCPKGVERMNFSPERFITLKTLDMKP